MEMSTGFFRQAMNALVDFRVRACALVIPSGYKGAIRTSDYVRSIRIGAGANVVIFGARHVVGDIILEDGAKAIMTDCDAVGGAIDAKRASIVCNCVELGELEADDSSITLPRCKTIHSHVTMKGASWLEATMCEEVFGETAASTGTTLRLKTRPASEKMRPAAGFRLVECTSLDQAPA